MNYYEITATCCRVDDIESIIVLVKLFRDDENAREICGDLNFVRQLCSIYNKIYLINRFEFNLFIAKKIHLLKYTYLAK